MYLLGNDPIAIATIVTISAMLFSFIATSNQNYIEAGTLGAVTVVLILIGQYPTIASAIDRCLEISLGILIAAVISQFVLPIHARNHLRRNQATTIRQLRDYYKSTLLTDHAIQDEVILINLDENIAKSLIAQRKLAIEARRERIGTALNIDHFQQSLWCEKEILRCVMFMYRAYQASDVSKQIIANISILDDFHKTICAALEKIAHNIEYQKNDAVIIPDIQPLKRELSEASKNIAETEKINIDSFLFCTQLLIARLEKLTALISESKSHGGHH